MSEPMKPMEIEQRSFEIITELLGNRVLDPENELVIKRVIHTTADFDYADNLTFSDHAVQKGIAALKGGCDIVTDTQMAKAGINKTILASLGGEVHCFMSDPDVAQEAKSRGVTRAFVSMEKAAALEKPCIFAIGNAPTALLSLEQLMEEGKAAPALIIVGMFMMSSVLKVKFEGDMADVLGAFVAIIMMPFTYSIANGIMFGVLTWMVLRIVRGKIRDIHPVMWIVFALFVIRIVTLVI